jgi:DTW domain-containing protein YfiP
MSLCVCADVTPAPSRTHVLILQHPQEPDKELGTARLAHLALANSTLKVGLSWPNLSKAVGRQVVNANWGVLYLGARSERDLLPPGSTERLWLASRKNPPVPALGLSLEGIVILDGTWAQAKTIWWRNPWLLKLKRLILNPSRPSLYGGLRKEPRREAVSTIEAIAEVLEALGEGRETPDLLREHFKRLLGKWREMKKGQG